MKAKKVVVLLSVMFAYGLCLTAMEKTLENPKERAVLQRSASEELSKRSTGGLGGSDGIKKQAPRMSSNERIRAATVQNYAGFPHSGMIPEESQNALASSDSSRSSFTRSFYDTP